LRQQSYMFHTPAFDAPFEYCHNVWYGKKLECWCYYDVRVIENIFTRFDKYTNVTEGRTDVRTTDGQTPHDGIGRAMPNCVI